MKTIVIKISFLLLALFSFSSHAEKVVITGEPVVLEKRGDVYVVPSAYTAATPYHYVTLDGTNRVCYAEAQPNLASLNMSTVTVDVNGTPQTWTCYDYDTTYFEVTP
ncbi:hypothetical protein [Legionella septentrionalis]|uniref:hypothetical protein n=1 Tax=Legionella septentrionalis TaxID=2498109 RepID=UPI000F8F2522|nr:hypothetical protein [Legionella septentrionalis]RUR09690.1 hypothetical protein ELY14_07765 [Legionella septentrionalis]